MFLLGNTNSEVRCYAAYLLGQRRISDAAPALAQMITLEAAFRDNPHEWFWGKNPAVEALIKIGDPAIADVLRNLQESNDAKVRELSMRVIYHIDRKDKGFVRLRLEKALAVQDNTEKKARLQTALRFLQVSDFLG